MTSSRQASEFDNLVQDGYGLVQITFDIWDDFILTESFKQILGLVLKDRRKD